MAYASHYAFQQQTKYSESFNSTHKKIAVGLNVGGVFEGITAALGLKIQKTIDTISVSKEYQDIQKGEVEEFQKRISQIYRIITLTINVNGHTAETEEETYVDVVKKNDSATFTPEKLNEMAREYVRDHFAVEIQPGQSAKFTKRFCTFGKFIAFINKKTVFMKLL